MKIIVSHSGKQHSYQVAKAVKYLDRLDVFYTSSYVRSRLIQNILLRCNNKFFTRRFLVGLNGTRIRTKWQFEFKEIAFRVFFGKTRITQNAVYQRDVRFDNYVANQISKQSRKGKLKSNLFWGFQGSCFKSVQIAKELGMITVVELATAHVVAAKRILGDEQRLHPEWADSIDNLTFPEEYERRLLEEPLLADYVVVASDFTKKSVLEIGVPLDKIIYLPLGAEVSTITAKNNVKVSDEKIKIVYVGTITQRKGVKYLLEAMKQRSSDAIELHIYGHVHGSGSAFEAYSEYITYHGAVSQQELFKLYTKYDYLILPSIFEGFGLVLVEAMAAGLPVITTRNTFGADFIDDGENGFLIDVRSVAAISEVFNFIEQSHEANYAKYSYKALSTVKNFTWEKYRDRLEKVLNEIQPRSSLNSDTK